MAVATKPLPNPYKRIAASIATANSMDEVAKLLLDFPEAIKSRSVTNALLVEMGNILKRSSETVVSFPFMMAVIQCTQAYYEMGEPSDSLTADNHSVGTAGWQILQMYLRTLIEKDKDALKNAYHRNPANAEYVRNCNIRVIRDDYYSILGIVYLVINYNRWDTLDQKLYNAFGGGREQSKRGFLRILMDIAIPSGDPNRISDLCARIWHAVDMDRTDAFVNMIRHWDGNIEVFTRILDVYFSDEDKNDSQTRSECMELFVQLANIARSTYTAETMFYEYIEMLRHYYPLDAKRNAICDRYSKYYGEDDTISYMASIHSALMAGYGDAEVSAAVLPHDSSNRVNMEIERIVYHIYAMHPQVDWRVTQLFFRNVLECHGFYFKHYSESSISVANVIIDAMEAAKREIEAQPEMNVVDALESTVQALYAMEADDMGYPDFQDDYKGEKTDHSGNDADDEQAANTVDTRDMHKSIDAKSAWEKFQAKKPEIDAQINNVTMTVRKALAEGKQAILINGQPKSIIWTIAKLYAGFGIFRASKTGFALMMVVNHYLKKGTRSQRMRLLRDVENELVMVDEKIQDASGDGNREAKYELMRTKQNLLEARNRLKYGVGAKMRRSGWNGLSTNVRGYGG